MPSIVEALRQVFVELDITKLPYRPSTMLDMVTKRDIETDELWWRTNVGGAVVSGRAVTADVGTGDDAGDTLKKASLPIGNRVVGHKFSVMSNEITKAMAIGEGEVARLFEQFVNESYDVILPELSRVIYVGTGNAASHEVFGINQAVDATAYAGIAKASFPLWQGYLSANGGTARALSKSMFDLVDIYFQENIGLMYDRIVTTPKIVKKYGNLFATDRSLTVTSAPTQADIGFSGYSYAGVPIMYDTQCPAGSMYFMRSSALEFYTFKNRPISYQGRVVKTDTKVESTFGMNFSIAELQNRNPDKVEIEISVKPQLKITNPRHIAIVRDIIET